MRSNEGNLRINYFFFYAFCYFFFFLGVWWCESDKKSIIYIFSFVFGFCF